jgi:L-ribulose-5-phosphate 3-epimerase
MLHGRPLGVMQGRLLPKVKGRYQAHPKGNWPDEFPIARSFGLDLIEFILDFEDAEDNPLLVPGGVERIWAASRASGIAVRSICADYFMEAPLHSRNTDDARESRTVLKRVIGTARDLGVTDIVIPCVDQSSLQDRAARNCLVEALRPALSDAEAAGVNLALETDLSPEDFLFILDRLPSPRLTVNYDIGNSAALGYDPKQEFAAYGSRISDIHVKDRNRGGGPVPLGDGDADIPGVFRLMDDIGFMGPVILQAFRDDEGVAVFGRQLAWLHERVEVHT